MSGSDRELLELAAKAYFGADGFEWNSCAGFAGRVQYIPSGCSHYVSWNPLTDDGDALRLAVQLKIAFDPLYDEVCSYTRVNHLHGLQNDVQGIRRAIVRAAAEIGRSMP